MECQEKTGYVPSTKVFRLGRLPSWIEDFVPITSLLNFLPMKCRLPTQPNGFWRKLEVSKSNTLADWILLHSNSVFFAVKRVAITITVQSMKKNEHLIRERGKHWDMHPAVLFTSRFSPRISIFTHTLKWCRISSQLLKTCFRNV